MKPTLLSPALLILLPLAAWSATEENFVRQHPAKPGGKLVLDVDFGAIEVVTGKESEVRVEVERRVTLRSAEQERDYLAKHPVTVAVEGTEVRVEARGGKLPGWNGWRGRKFEGRYRIEVPEQFDLELQTHAGPIRIGPIEGRVEAKTSGGKLDLEGIRGPLFGETSGGPVQVRRCEGEITVKTSGGAMEIEGGKGTLTARTSGGGIRVQTFDGSVHLRTSGGGVTVESVRGAIDGATSGGSMSAVLVSPLAGDVKLQTSGGSVGVRVAEQSAFNLDAATSGGGVTAEFSVETTGKRERDRLVGKVNGGGPTVTLRSSGGGIRVRKL